MTDEELLRYSRHILLDDIGIEGQQRLSTARVVVIGAGGLGSPVALYLGAAGVGQITLVDNDKVDFSNLQRQIAHHSAGVGQNKAASAAEAIHRLNPLVQVHVVAERADAALLAQLVAQADLVLDCCDNFATRHAVNAACVQHKVPLVSGAAVRWDAQITMFNPREPLSPCYACLYPPHHAPQEVQCSTMGVLAPLVGIIGAMQAAESIKHLSGVGASLVGQLMMLDARRMDWTRLRIARDAHCPVCHAG